MPGITCGDLQSWKISILENNFAENLLIWHNKENWLQSDMKSILRGLCDCGLTSEVRVAVFTNTYAPIYNTGAWCEAYTFIY
jgi:hypothetical protein